MPHRDIKIEFNSRDDLLKEFETNLKNGGTFVAKITSLQEHDECDIVLYHPVTNDTLTIHAKAVWIAPDHSGAGVAFIGFTPEKRDEIYSFVIQANQSQSIPDAQTSSGPEPGETDSPREESILDAYDDGDGNTQSLHQRLRNLSVMEQHKVARGNVPSERIALERIYGKTVWEPLLQNPRLTIPEVARIARMGALPVPMVELIVSNATWVSSPPVRRALLTNPRLGRDQIPRVLKSMPQAELRLVPKQMGYTAAVRETARRMLGRN